MAAAFRSRRPHPGVSLAFVVLGLPITATAQSSGISLSSGAGTELTETEPKGLATGDLNGDGNVDLIAALCGCNSQSGGNKVQILFGNGSGGFPQDSTVTVGYSPWAVALDDANQDGKLDFAVSTHAYATTGTESVRIFLGNGNGTFAAGVTLNDGGFPLDVDFADLNQDGKPDLITTFNNSGGIKRSFGDGTGFYGPGASVAASAPNAAFSTTEVDLDGDDDLDLFIVGYSNTKVTLLNDGTGAFAPPPSGSGLAVPNGSGSYAFGDVNGDTRTDVVLVTSTALTTYVGTATGFHVAATTAAPSQPFAPQLVDLDGNGVLDLATTSGLADQITLFAGVGDGSFLGAQSYGTGGYPNGTQPGATVAGDFNGDGLVDVGVACRNLGETPYFVRYLNTSPTPTFVALGPGLGPVGGAPPLLAGDGGAGPGVPVTLAIKHGAPSAPAGLIIGFSEANLPFLGGTLVPTPTIVLLGLPTDSNGNLTLVGNTPQTLPPAIYLQAWIPTATGPAGAIGTNGLAWLH